MYHARDASTPSNCLARKVRAAMVHLTTVIAITIVSALLAAPLVSQIKERVLPVSHDLFLAGYIYGKLFRYYSRSLANFETLTNAQKNDDREIMIDLSVNLETHVRSLGCPPKVLQAINAVESELSARGKPKELRLSQIDSLRECINKYSSDLGRYWWTGRSVGSLSFLFENLERPQIDLRPNSSDRVLLEELKYLGDNSILLYGAEDLPPRVEQLLKALENIRMTNLQKGELDAATRNLVKRYVNEIPQSFLSR